jgi:hypothetical protein
MPCFLSRWDIIPSGDNSRKVQTMVEVDNRSISELQGIMTFTHDNIAIGLAPNERAQCV